MKKHNNKGYTLIELLIVIVFPVIFLIVLGFIFLVARFLWNLGSALGG